MNDVMKKRLTGLLILIAIAVLIPLLLARCMHGTDGNQNPGSMRVYNIKPDGQLKRVGQQQASDTSLGQATQIAQNNTAPADTGHGHSSSAPQGAQFSTPKSHGNTGGQTKRPPDNAGQENAGTPSGHAAQSVPPQAATQSGSHKAHKTQSVPQQSAAQNDKHPVDEKSGSATANKAPGDNTKESHLNGWVVQVASFSKRANARALAADLKGDYQASYSRVNVKGKNYYHVIVGPFNDKSGAESAAQRLHQADHGSLVRHLP
jgi:cell division septation protein DedD